MFQRLVIALSEEQTLGGREVARMQVVE